MAMQHAIEEATRPALSDPVRWLLAGSLALAFAALGVIDRAYAAAGAARWSGPAARWAFAAAAAALTVGLDLWRRADARYGVSTPADAA